MNIRYFFPILVAIFIPWIAFAQNSPVSSGGVGNGEGGSFTYSFGQTFYHVIGWNITFAEGVIQPYEISLYDPNGDLVEEVENDMEYTVYPNPTDDFLMLSISGSAVNNIEFQLLNIEGQIIAYQQIESEETRIDLQHLPPTTYMLRIMQKGKDLKTFKIIKQ